MRYWAQMTSAEVETLDGANTIAVLPVAAIEQHGAHLPLGTDAHIAEAFLVDAAEALQEQPMLGNSIICLPMQTIGHSPEHTDFAGTLSADAEVFIAFWEQIGASVARSGIQKLVIINSHGGNSALLDIVARRLRMEFEMLVVATHWMKLVDISDVVSADELKFGVHGGQVETSLMLSIAPQLVQIDKAGIFPSSQQRATQNFTHLKHYGSVLTGWMAQDLNPTGVVGNAASATQQLGMDIRFRVQQGFIALLNDVKNASGVSLG